MLDLTIYNTKHIPIILLKCSNTHIIKNISHSTWENSSLTSKQSDVKKQNYTKNTYTKPERKGRLNFTKMSLLPPLRR